MAETAQKGSKGVHQASIRLRTLESQSVQLLLVANNALLLADVNSDGDSNREVYKLLGEKLKILEVEIKACQR